MNLFGFLFGILALAHVAFARPHQMIKRADISLSDENQHEKSVIDILVLSQINGVICGLSFLNIEILSLLNCKSLFGAQSGPSPSTNTSTPIGPIINPSPSAPGPVINPSPSPVTGSASSAGSSTQNVSASSFGRHNQKVPSPKNGSTTPASLSDGEFGSNAQNGAGAGNNSSIHDATVPNNSSSTPTRLIPKNPGTRSTEWGRPQQQLQHTDRLDPE